MGHAMKYSKNWESIDSRNTPNWFKNSKLGIFIHWGPYSVPAYAPRRSEVDDTGSAYAEWYGWFVRTNREKQTEYHKKNFNNEPYENFGAKLTGEKFNADEWVKLFKEAGAKYIVLVTKHHDAYTLFPSKYSKGWNALDIGLKRDVVKELFDSCDKYGIARGAYYSLMEWPSPVFTGKEYTEETASEYAKNKMFPQIKELITNYKPQILFTDGEWDYDSNVWHSLDVLSWIFNESPVKDSIVVNDRWGKDCRGVHGGYKTCEYGEVNSQALSEEDAQSNLNNSYWEECRSIGNSFGYNANENVEDYLTTGELIKLLVSTVSKGGNLCLNVGPKADGSIPEIVINRLKELGEFMKINGEAIYSSNKSSIVKDDGIYRTEKDGAIYNIILDNRNDLSIYSPKPVSNVSILGIDKHIKFVYENNKVILNLDNIDLSILKYGCTVKFEF